MNTQYRKNLKAVAQACKDYTDNKIKKVYYDIGHNDITTDDHIDEATYQITAPANAKLLMLQSIGGNAVKYNPSVASDSTKAMIKTMPSTVYTFDGSKFYGASEVSENLLVLDDVSERTSNGITYKIENGVITLSGTATNYFVMTIATDVNNIGDCYFKSFYSGTLSANNIYRVYYSDETDGYLRYDVSTVISKKISLLRIYVDNGKTINMTLYPMLVKGTTAPTEFKVGYTGIHNLELSELKVEGANLVIETIENVRVNESGTIVAQSGDNLCVAEVRKGQTYFFSSDSSESNVIAYYENYPALNSVSYNNSRIIAQFLNTSFVAEIDGYVVIKVKSQTYTMLNYGSTALAYVPYIAPTTKTIDLSTILYNGSPLFEGNSLKGVNDVKDSITPYKATKKLGRKTISQWTYNPSTGFIRSAVINDAKAGNDDQISNILSDNYETKTYNDMKDNHIIGIAMGDNKQVYIYTGEDISPTVDIEYELATPIEVSIDWSATLRNIQGYPNGSIIAENTHNMDVESVITYNSIIQETLCPSITITRNGVDILTRNIPTQASDGWSAGTSRNYRVFCDDEGNEVSKRENNVYKENHLEQKDWSWTDAGANSRFWVPIYDAKKPISNAVAGNILINNYENVDWDTFVATSTNLVSLRGTDGVLGIRDNKYSGATITDLNIFKTSLVNDPLYYELADASKTETPMDDFDFFFDVEEGDVITFNNPYAQQVYATYSFLIKEAKSNE